MTAAVLESPEGVAFAGFALVAVALLVLALPSATAVALVPALLAFLVGVVLLAIGDGPAGARWASLVLGAYVVLLFGLFLASTPITIGKLRLYVNPEPPAWADEAFRYATDALPAVLVLGAGAVLWAWSGLVGRVLVALAGAGVVAFLVITFLAVGDGTAATEAAVARLERFGRIAQGALALATLALVAATALVLKRDRIPWDVD